MNQLTRKPEQVSPPTARVVAVLDHLATQPHRGFGLTELARELDMSKSTCLAVLRTLTDSGYLMRHPTRRDYRLGPALVAAGRAAMRRFPDLSGARGFLGAASSDIDLPINVVALADAQLVICERVGATDPFAGYARIGVGVPFVPPYGAGFVAWADSHLWNSWIGTSDMDAEHREALTSSLRIANGRGYLVTQEIPATDEFHPLLEHLRHLDRTVDSDQFEMLARRRMAGVDFFLDHIDIEVRYAVNLIQAPVLPLTGQTPLLLMATAFGKVLAGAEIEAVGERLHRAGRELAAHLRSSP